MKRLLLVLSLSAGFVFANVNQSDDLLNIATQGKIKGSQFEMNKNDMKEADGGYIYIPSFVRTMQYRSTYNYLRSKYNNQQKSTYRTSNPSKLSYAQQMYNSNPNYFNNRSSYTPTYKIVYNK